MMNKIFKSLAALALIAPLAAGPVQAGDDMLEVTITNVTAGQIFAHIVVATHKSGAPIFTPGGEASDGLAALAETGNPTLLVGELEAIGSVRDVTYTEDVLTPGASVTVQLSGKGKDRVSIAGMLVSTNDGFVGLNGVAAPKGEGSLVYEAAAWDAGSEINDENCDNIPGPPCAVGSGNGGDDEDGVVLIHGGIDGNLGIGGNGDWRNPVAIVTITRVNHGN